MCEFCKDMRNSDDVESVFLSRSYIGNIMGNNMSVIMGIDCYEHGNTGKFKLYAMFDVEHADIDAETSIDIQYCPMCGRKLAEV